MKGGTTRAVLCIALLFLLPLAPTLHIDHVDGGTRRPGMAATDDGPFSPCPPAPRSPCIACASAALFAPPVPFAHLGVPAEAAGELRDAGAPALPTASASAPIGRSPPAA